MYAHLVRGVPPGPGRDISERIHLGETEHQYFLNSAWKEDFGHAFHTERDFGFN